LLCLGGFFFCSCQSLPVFLRIYSATRENIKTSFLLLNPLDAWQVLEGAERRRKELEELAAQERADQEAVAQFNKGNTDAAAKEAELRQKLGY